jgi:hypothetical protein
MGRGSVTSASWLQPQAPVTRSLQVEMISYSTNKRRKVGGFSYPLEPAVMGFWRVA